MSERERERERERVAEWPHHLGIAMGSFVLVYFHSKQTSGGSVGKLYAQKTMDILSL